MADHAEGLVPLDVHRRAVLERIVPLDPIELGLLEAHGCVLAEDVVAPADVPGFRASSMDGYAVVAATVEPGASLAVVGESAAGSGAEVSLRPGEAVRIMTGAPLPAAADAVVPVERSAERDGHVVLDVAPQPGDYVRAPDDAVRAGTTVLRAGRRVDAPAVGLLAAVGRASVLVRPRPRVAVVATGDELVEPDATPAAAGRPPAPGRLRDANSYVLTAMAREAGAVASRQPLVRDDERALTDAFEGALAVADLLVVTGGVSAGRYDLVKVVLARMGDVVATKVGMQPGMPQAFGLVPAGPGRMVPVFGLPGNPVSAAVSFEVFVRPAIRRLQGRTDLNRPRVGAALTADVRSPANKVSFLRVKLRRVDGTWHAELTGDQSSGILRSLVEADGLAEVPADRTTLAAGERVTVHLLVDPL